MFTQPDVPERLIPPEGRHANSGWASERKAALILGVITMLEGGWLLLNLSAHPARFFQFAGFAGPLPDWPAVLCAAIITALFIWYSAQFPSVRANLLRWSRLKLLALAVAIGAGFCEEIVFRKVLMDSLQHAGFGILIQLAASGAAFGGAHAIWGLFRGSLQAAVGAALVTSVLGAALALVYAIGGRNIAPCIVSHFLINAFAEPGLVLAAVRGEMSGSAIRSSGHRSGRT